MRWWWWLNPQMAIIRPAERLISTCQVHQSAPHLFLTSTISQSASIFKLHRTSLPEQIYSYMVHSRSSSQTSRAPSRKVVLQSSEQDSLAVVKQEPDLVLVIFIHGFKGTEETFGDFPQRLQHLLSETLEHTTVEALVFPAYEVRLITFKITSCLASINYLFRLQTKGELVSSFC